MYYPSAIRSVIALAFLLLAGFFYLAPSVRANNNDISETMSVKAPADVVWKAITSADQFQAQVKSTKDDEAVVEQSFYKIPFYGEVKATLRVKAKPNEVLSYDLIEAKMIKGFSGSWILTAIDKSTTRLKLTSNVDPGLPIPRFLVNQFIRGKVKGRLKKSQVLAEELYNKSVKTTAEVPKPDIARP
ncbi:MAG: SRPBCC family protein [Cyanobacteria bacterium REEB67]|nr:SRPBCC family protein [Cyanobacteria bacterium REEB67]